MERISMENVEKLSKEAPIIGDKKPQNYKKATDFGLFSKTYTSPVTLDKNTFINLSTTKTKSKQELLVYIYDISKNDKIALIENNMKELCSIKHTNIVPYSDVFVKVPKNEFGKYQFHLVTTLPTVTNPRNLDNLIYEKSRLKQKSYFTEADVLPWFSGALSALAVIHSTGFTHNNLTASSFLLVKNDKDIKIGSFGFGMENLLDFSTQSFIAPEVYDDKVFTVASDIFALGVTFLKVLVLKDLDVSQMDPSEIFKEIPQGVYDSELIKLIVSMVDLDATKRPKLKDLLDWIGSKLKDIKSVEDVKVRGESKSVLQKGRKPKIEMPGDVDSNYGGFLQSNLIQPGFLQTQMISESPRQMSFGRMPSLGSIQQPSRKSDVKSDSKEMKDVDQDKKERKDKSKGRSSSTEVEKEKKPQGKTEEIEEEEKEVTTKEQKKTVLAPPQKAPRSSEMRNKSSGIFKKKSMPPPPPMGAPMPMMMPIIPMSSVSRVHEATIEPEENLFGLEMMSDIQSIRDERMDDDEQEEGEMEQEQVDFQPQIIQNQFPKMFQSIDQQVMTVATYFSSDDSQLIRSYNLIRDAQGICELKKHSRPFDEQLKKFETDLSHQNTPPLLRRFFGQHDPFSPVNLLSNLESWFWSSRAVDKLVGKIALIDTLHSRLDNLGGSETSDKLMETPVQSKKSLFSFDLFACWRSDKVYKESEPTDEQIEEALQIEAKHGKERKEQYQATERIGEGASATVFLVRSKENQELYIMKVFNANSGGDAAQEISAFEDFKEGNHPSDHIVKFKEHFSYFDEDSVQQIVIMEYCEERDLARITKRRGKANSYLTESEILHIMIQVFDGLAFLHAKGYVHRDVKPENIFVKKGRFIKIGDFGLALKKNSGADRVYGGTAKYMSPEQFENVHDIGTEFIDVWAAGCVFLELMSRKVRDMKMEVSANNSWLDDIWRNDDLGPRYSSHIKTLLLRCFRMNPMERSTAIDMKGNLVMLKMQHVNGVVIQSSMRGSAARLNYKSLLLQEQETPRTNEKE